MKPSHKPKNPNFSSGPCSKRPQYAIENLSTHLLGRSHRSAEGKQMISEVIELSKSLLQLPKGYRLGIVPASDTGAFEMALWSLLGSRPVDICYWESFGAGWYKDITTELRLEQVHEHKADYGQLPDLSKTKPEHDIVFTWNGTTSGVCVDNDDWISSDRSGLTICDATSAVFAMDIPWQKIDVATYSWQKVLGGEAAHGVLILSERAVKRLEEWRPNWPLPKIFRLTQQGQLMEDIFQGATINTPSMLCIADYLDTLYWLESIGGLSQSIERCNQNLAVIERFVNSNPWISFLAENPSQRSNTSVCLQLVLNSKQVKQMCQLLQDEKVAFDIESYRDAPNGLRIWCGTTIESQDLELLMPWIDWAYQRVHTNVD